MDITVKNKKITGFLILLCILVASLYFLKRNSQKPDAKNHVPPTKIDALIYKQLSSAIKTASFQQESSTPLKKIYPKECEESWQKIVAYSFKEFEEVLKNSEFAFSEVCQNWEKEAFGKNALACIPGQSEDCLNRLGRYRSIIIDMLYPESIPVEDLSLQVLWHKMIARSFNASHWSKDAEYINKVAEQAHKLNPDASWPLQVKLLYADHSNISDQELYDLADAFKRLPEQDETLKELEIERYIQHRTSNKDRFLSFLDRKLSETTQEDELLALKSEMAWHQDRFEESLALMEQSQALKADEDKAYAIDAMKKRGPLVPFRLKLNFRVFWAEDALDEDKF